MSNFLCKKTMGLRYNMVKVLAPKVYSAAYYAVYSNRPMDYFLKKKYGSTLLTGVEIGVFKAEHAKCLLDRLNFNKLYLVDSYLPFVEEGIVCTKEEVDSFYQTAVHTLEKYPAAKLLRLSSIDAATVVPDDLDFVYIDATHTYEGVKSDIMAWYSKVKVGGVFGGHDFEPKFFSVVRAVTDFVKATQSKLYFSSPDWWLVKGEKNEGYFS